MKNITDAKNYVERIKEGSVEDSLATSESALALKFLAEDGDEEGFRIVVEIMCYHLSLKEKLKHYAKEPLAFVESMCMVLDHPVELNYRMFQTYRGIKMKRLPIRKTQKFFQKIYGSCFFR